MIQNRRDLIKRKSLADRLPLARTKTMACSKSASGMNSTPLPKIEKRLMMIALTSAADNRMRNGRLIIHPRALR